MLRLGDILVSAGALVVFGFSFAPFVQYDESSRDDLADVSEISPTFNAWATETFMVPLTTFVIAAALLAAAAVWVRFAVRRDPSLLGFRLRQLEVGLTLFGFAVLLAMVVSDKAFIFGYDQFVDAGFYPADEGRMDTGWGAVLLLLGALIALVGALLNHLGVGPSITVGAAQPAPPQAYPAQQPYQPPQPYPGAQQPYQAPQPYPGAQQPYQSPQPYQSQQPYPGAQQEQPGGYSPWQGTAQPPTEPGAP